MAASATSYIHQTGTNTSIPRLEFSPVVEGPTYPARYLWVGRWSASRPVKGTVTALTPSSPAVDEAFGDLATRWRQETFLLSSVAQITAHPAYQQIIGMGHQAVERILGDLVENGPDHWFWALTAITRENPITADIAGDLERMTEAWLEWGKERGYVT